METVILEKTIIKSKTPKGITEVQTVPWGCGKYLLEMDDRCQHGMYHSFEMSHPWLPTGAGEPLGERLMQITVNILRLGSLLALGFGEAGPLRTSLFAKPIND